MIEIKRDRDAFLGKLAKKKEEHEAETKSLEKIANTTIGELNKSETIHQASKTALKNEHEARAKAIHKLEFELVKYKNEARKKIEYLGAEHAKDKKELTVGVERRDVVVWVLMGVLIATILYFMK